MALITRKAAEMILPIGKRKNKGFLLLEVMVSITILCIGLVLILGSFMRSIRAIELSEDYFKAGLLLEEKIYEVHNSNIEEGLSEGVFTNFRNRFSWNLTVEALIGDDFEGLNEVALEVSWDQGGKKQSILAPTYIYQRHET